METMSFLQRKRPSERQSKYSDETTFVEGDVCQYNKKTSYATSFCKVCSEHLCKICQQAHRGSKATRHHKVMTVNHSTSSADESVLPTTHCKEHKSTKLSLYCFDHDAVICQTCTNQSHKKCNTTDITTKTKVMETREKIAGILAELENLHGKFCAFKNARIEDRVVNQTRTTEYIRALQNFRDLVDKMIRKVENEVSELMVKKLKEVEDQLALVDDALNDLNIHRQVLDECQKNDDLISMFVSQRNADAIKTKYDAAILELEDHTQLTDMRFEPNKIVHALLSQLQSLVHANNEHSSVPNRPLSRMAIIERQEIDIGSHNVCDCAFIGEQYLILACVNDGLTLLDKDFNIISTLPRPSFGVANCGDNEIIVSSMSKFLRFVKILPGMAETKTLTMDRQCFGIDVCNSEIYVACHDNPGNGEVVVLDMYGEILRKLGMSKSAYMLHAPECVKVTSDGTQVFVSDRDTDIVTCFGRDGDVLCRFSDDDLKDPTGMFLDEAGILFVCSGAGSSHKVHMISQDGKMRKVFLSPKDVKKRPVCLAYRDFDSCMVIGLVDAEKSLLVFKAKVL